MARDKLERNKDQSVLELQSDWINKQEAVKIEKW